MTKFGFSLICEEHHPTELVANAQRAQAAGFDLLTSGPHGWAHGAHGLGRTEAAAGASVEGVSALLRRVRPLVEPRVDFTLSRAELASIDRGAEDADLEALARAARQMALAENVAVFHGWEAAGIAGVTGASPH